MLESPALITLLAFAPTLVASAARCRDHPLAFIDPVNVWPLCCVLVIAITYPLSRALHRRDPHHDSRRPVLLACVLVSALVGWLRWGSAGLC
ncbi:MAG: hypothetical protein H6713_04185 [Myxococcales bacterium]|nr:hypothetical protein [Myxococcales bacterium]